jgi:hypothetical protein
MQSCPVALTARRSRDPMSIEIENYLHQVNQPVKQESDFVIWNDNFLAKLNHHSYHQDQSSKAVTDQIRALHEVAKNKQTS